MIILDNSFMLSGGGSDYPPKSTARNEPFPDSSSTPVQKDPPANVPAVDPEKTENQKLLDRIGALEHDIADLRDMINNIYHGPDLLTMYAAFRKQKQEEDIPEELSPKKFHELIKKARVVKPELLTRETASKYPEINNIAKQMTADDFINATKLWTQEQESLMSRLINERIQLTDKACFDCFKEYLDCQKADDVFVIMTSSVLYHHYNEILPLINARIAEYVGGPCMGLGEMTEPAAGSREMLETLRARWDEIYKEDNNESDQSGV